MSEQMLRGKIRDVPDFPKPGVSFKDIGPLLEDKVALSRSVEMLAEIFKNTPPDKILGTEARGFLFGVPLAFRLWAGFVMARKKGKLPGKTIGRSYGLEYGTSHLEIQVDSVKPGEKVLIVDDVLATGGTALAAAQLVEELKGVVVGFGFVIELPSLGGRKLLGARRVESLVVY